MFEKLIRKVAESLDEDKIPYMIIHKMVAGRAVDLEDVRSMLAKNKGSVDLKYVKRWLAQFRADSEQRDILKDFNGLLKHD